MSVLVVLVGGREVEDDGALRLVELVVDLDVLDAAVEDLLEGGGLVVHHHIAEERVEQLLGRVPANLNNQGLTKLISAEFV